MIKQIGFQLSADELHLRQQSVIHHQDGPIVVAVGLTDPYNIGGILRCAEAIGCKQVYFVDSSVSEKKIKKYSRSTSSLVDSKFITREEFSSISQLLPHLVALEITSGSVDIFAATYPKDITIVVGAENAGIPDDILQLCAQAIHLPMVGVNSSINVVCALCTALYEWHRKFRT